VAGSYRAADDVHGQQQHRTLAYLWSAAGARGKLPDMVASVEAVVATNEDAVKITALCSGARQAAASRHRAGRSFLLPYGRSARRTAFANFSKFSLASRPFFVFCFHIPPMSYRFILFTLYIAMTMTVPTPANTTPSSTSASVKDHSAQIQQLSDEVERPTTSLNDANKWYTRFSGLTVLATALLVLFGLGTLLTQGSAINTAERLSSINKQIAELQRQDFESNLKAKDVEIGKAQQAAGEATERASANEKEAARLNKLAEEEKLARVKIEKRVGPRVITPEQEAFIARSLTAFKGQRVSLTIAVDNSNDFEIGQFLPQLYNAFMKAGLVVSMEALFNP
jgi:hypothetical protein